MNLRQLVYTALSYYAYAAAVALHNRIYAVFILNDDALAYVNGLVEYTAQVAQGFVNAIPWWIQGVLGWMLSLVIDHIIRPVSEWVKTPLIFIHNTGVALYDYASGMYIPARWLFDILNYVRDRIDNAFQWAEEKAYEAVSYLVGIYNGVMSTIQGIINALSTALGDLVNYVTHTILDAINSAVVNIVTLQQIVTQIYNELQVITSNPVEWIWKALEPELERRVSDFIIKRW